jgi:two-component system, NarL family, response regulator DesR
MPAPPPEPRPIKVLLAVDMDLLRSALVTLLSDEEDIEVVADLKCHDKIVLAALPLHPDVAVVDVDMPCSHGLSAVRDLRRRLPECQVVALTAGKPAVVQSVLAAEVLGVVDKNASAERLLQTIRGVAKGELVVDVNLAVAALAIGSNPFTPRELEVLRLVADGASAPEIAKRLSLAKGTVRNYLSKVICKTGAKTRIDAIRIVREAGWL